MESEFIVEDNFTFSDKYYKHRVSISQMEMEDIKDSLQKTLQKHDENNNDENDSEDLFKSEVFYNVAPPSDVASTLSRKTSIASAAPPPVCPFSQKPIKVTNFSSNSEHFDSLFLKAKCPIACKENRCYGSMMAGQSMLEKTTNDNFRSKAEVREQALEVLADYYESLKSANSVEHMTRVSAVEASIESTGSWDATYDELCYAAKQAWRNAARCIGRIQYKKLKVFDCRSVRTTDEMFKAVLNHIKYATNDGNLQSALSVFPKRVAGAPDFRVWNQQLISYAGYRQEDGSIVGDPARVKITEICEALGWKGNGGRFDVLPLVLNASGEDPKFYEIPDELVLQVEMKHPRFDWFEDMGLRWYGLPAVANMMFDVGGVQYPAAPFNGWYMSSEIGTRDFCDPHRYNLVEEVAVKMGLDTTSTVNLWKDQALVEINIAVLHSFQLRNVTITDHHTASESFIKHYQDEQKERGGCPADWVWIVPPLSSGLTSVFHQEMVNYNLRPSYEYQEHAWKTHVWLDKELEKHHKGDGRKIPLKSVASAVYMITYMMRRCMGKRIRARILYATETGKSESYAKRAAAVFKKAFHAEVCRMEDYRAEELLKEQLVLIVSSTFGSGDAPDNGKSFQKELQKMAQTIPKVDDNNNGPDPSAYGEEIANSKTRFAVFALGSSAYPDFCEFGKFCDRSLDKLGGTRVTPVATGDELRGQEQSFRRWVDEAFKGSCHEFGIKLDMVAMERSGGDLMGSDDDWSPDLYRLTKAGEQLHDLCEGLSAVHHRTVMPCKMLSRTQLQTSKSSRRTILARLDTRDASELSYEPGDHLGIFPENPRDLVAGVVRRLKNVQSLTDLMMLQTVDKDKTRANFTKSWKPLSKLPPCSILTALTNYLDLTTPPTQHFLKLMANAATDNDEKNKLNSLVNDDDHYENWRDRKFPNLLEVLEEFPSVRLDATLLLSQAPVMQPRFYSISSSPRRHSGEVHVTVGVVSYQIEDGSGKTHHGLCSSYLNSYPTSDIPCFIRRAPAFHLPTNQNSPVIMIGAGTGVAPFRGFWQQRELEFREMQGSVSSATTHKAWYRSMFDCKSGAFIDVGRMTLYFGCRNPAEDHVYQEETKSLAKHAALFQTRVAYSRLAGQPKVYVQHLVEEDGASIYRQLTREDAHLYICGEASMAADVRNVLKRVFEKYGHMDANKASELLQTLKAERKINEDIFGSLSKFKPSN